MENKKDVIIKAATKILSSALKSGFYNDSFISKDRTGELMKEFDKIVGHVSSVYEEKETFS